MQHLKKALSFLIYNLISQISAYNFFLTKKLPFNYSFYQVFSSSKSYISCFETLLHFHPAASYFFNTSYSPFLSKLSLSKQQVLQQISPSVKRFSSNLWQMSDFLESFLAGLQTSPSFYCKRLLNFWHLKTPLSLLTFLNQETPEWHALNNLIYKAMKRLNTPQLNFFLDKFLQYINCLLYTSPSPRDLSTSRMPSSA